MRTSSQELRQSFLSPRLQLLMTQITSPICPAAEPDAAARSATEWHDRRDRRMPMPMPLPAMPSASGQPQRQLSWQSQSEVPRQDTSGSHQYEYPQ